MSRDPVYGSSTHYTGEAGAEYFAWQDSAGEINGRINARKFENFLSDTNVLLDFGCGGGHLIRALNAKYKIGVEINPIARASATNYCDQVFESIDLVESATVDVVISNHALEHVPYPIKALAELHRVLKINGTLIVCVPIDDWRTQRVFTKTDINHHLNTWSPQLFGNSLSEAGFNPNPDDIRVYTHAWFPNYLRIWKRRRIFDFLCWLYSIKVRRRQLLAIAKKIV
jgi:SAM-dependent methyltransferase